MKDLRSQQGFTLIELVVVVSMITLIAGVALFQLSGASNNADLDSAVALLQSDLRHTIAWAQSGELCCDGDPTKSVPNGYGIFFTAGASTYTIYADLDADNVYDAGTEDVQTVDLENGEGLSNVIISTCTECDLFIESPSGDVYTDGDTTDNTSVTIAHSQTGDTETLTINVNTGQIE